MRWRSSRAGASRRRSACANTCSAAPGEVDETPKPGDPLFARVETRMIATAHRSLEAAAALFAQAGVRPVLLGDTVTGEARDVAQVMAAIAREIVRYDQPFARPVALISGGECTVTIRGRGRGGRCSEFLLALATELRRRARSVGDRADTDGIDGTEANAGAVCAPTPWRAPRPPGSTRKRCSTTTTPGRFFDALGDLVVTGPTRTNVNDFRALVLLPQHAADPAP